MAYIFKETVSKPERLMPGHRMCAGCGAPIALRGVLAGLKEEDEAVICNATGCMEVSTFIYPYTAWKDSYIHTAFENAGATASGVEAAYRAMKKKGKVQGEYKIIAVGGDGGTYDIGFQSLSGAMERNTDMVYVCYDNEAYMNTGIQRSSATPRYADTTTTPVGSASEGKPQNRKDLAEVIAAHHVPYVGQTLGGSSDEGECVDLCVFAGRRRRAGSAVYKVKLENPEWIIPGFFGCLRLRYAHVTHIVLDEGRVFAYGEAADVRCFFRMIERK